MTNKDPGKVKKPPRPILKYKPGYEHLKKRSNSVALKAIWASPEGRARMIASIKAGSVEHRAERKANPDKFSRYGVPHGYTKATVAPLWAEARLKADKFIAKMVEEGIITDISKLVPESDEAKGAAALHEATILALGPTDKQLKLAAIRTVLEYTKSKPESKSKLSINTSEQWLALIAAEDAPAE